MKVALDYTPAIEQFAGVGRYTRSLFAAMHANAEPDVEWLLWRSSPEEPDMILPAGSDIIHSGLPVSARWTNLMWHRLGVPVPLERFAGDMSVVHGTDFVVPPSKAPSVVTIHDLSYALLPQLAFPRLRRFLDRAVPRSLDRATRIVAVSETTRRDLCEYYEISPNRVEVIHHAADPIFSPPDSSEILAMLAQFGLRRPYFITVGTIEPRKDHLTMIRAFERVHREHPEAAFVIVGRVGWLAEKTMEAIQSAASSMPVIHLQGIRDSVLPALYGGSAAMIYPSRYEGFGLPLLEAMSTGTPVIASDTPALQEVAGDAALFIPPEDDEALANNMIQLLENSERRDALIQAGFDRAARFSWDHAAREHLRIYREVSGE